MSGRHQKKPEYNPEIQFNNVLQELSKAYSSFDRLPEKRLRSVDFPHPAWQGIHTVPVSGHHGQMAYVPFQKKIYT